MGNIEPNGRGVKTTVELTPTGEDTYKLFLGYLNDSIRELKEKLKRVNQIIGGSGIGIFSKCSAPYSPNPRGPGFAKSIEFRANPVEAYSLRDELERILSEEVE